MRSSVRLLFLLVLAVAGRLLAQGQSLSDYAKAHPLNTEDKKGSLTVAGSSAPASKPTPQSSALREDATDPCRVETVAEASRLIDTRRALPGTKVTEPVPTYQSKPKYPEALRRRHIQGQVVAKAVVSCDGTLKDITVQGTPHPELVPLAMDAFLEWRYKPGIVNGQAHPFLLTVVVTFKAGKPPA
jgi:TonB family protein